MEVDILIYILSIISFIGILSVYVSEIVSFNTMCNMRGYVPINDRDYKIEDVINL
jgi:hypothetical protein